MIIPPLPQTLVPVMAFIAWFATNWLYHSPLKPWQNALIALLVPVFVAVLWAMGSGGFTRDLWGDIGLIVVLCYCAMAMPQLETWRQWFQDTFKSPFAWWPAPVTVEAEPAITTSQPPMTPYPTPTGINLRTTMITPRQLPPYRLDDTLQPMKPQPTEPMETPAPPVPVEESPAQH